MVKYMTLDRSLAAVEDGVDGGVQGNFQQRQVLPGYPNRICPTGRGHSTPALTKMREHGMNLYKTLRILFLLCPLLIFLTGCATMPYQPLSKDYNFTPNDEFLDLIYALVNDALDILPSDLQTQVTATDSVEKIMQGAINPGPTTKPNFSVSPANFGAQAAYVSIGIEN